eukprot:7010203-Prymnesium_polylepis.1
MGAFFLRSLNKPPHAPGHRPGPVASSGCPALLARCHARTPSGALVGPECCTVRWLISRAT